MISQLLVALTLTLSQWFVCDRVVPGGDRWSVVVLLVSIHFFCIAFELLADLDENEA